ncbi:dermonecrotic toxin domain-containing protein [Pseudomonas sp. S2_A02]
MNDHAHGDAPTPNILMHNELKAAVETALPQTPAQFGERLIKEKWGADIDPQTALLVTLDYNYHGHPPENGVHQGQVGNSRTLIQALLGNYQTVGDGRFGETVFGLYAPPDIGPSVRVVEKVDEFAYVGSGNHDTYEGIYRATVPQSYGPHTQINLRPADFKQWVWGLSLSDRYQTYLDQAWPSDAVIAAPGPYALRTSVKAAFVMAARLQYEERCLSRKGLELAMQAAGLPAAQTWEALTIEQLQAPTKMPPGVEASRLKLYRYTATDIWCFQERSGSRVLLYIPGNSSPLHEFTDSRQMRQWLVAQGRGADTKQALAAHFSEEDREDGTFHAGVLTALEGMAVYPKMHRLTKNAGFFNDDGHWDPDDYIDFDRSPSASDPFAQLVGSMKQAAQDSVKTIRDDAQVNRDNLSAFVEPIVQWINRFGPLALFVPGGEGLLVLAGLIDAGYGLEEAVEGQTPSERSEGVTRTVFGLLNALPLVGAVASLEREGADVAALTRTEHETGEPDVQSGNRPTGDLSTHIAPPEPTTRMPSRLSLLRGIGAPVDAFSDEVLLQIGKVSAIDDDLLRMMQAGRRPTPVLADTISRFKIDQDVVEALDKTQADGNEALQARRVELFNTRYQALQHSEHEWVRLFQQQYPGLPKSAVEQMLDRYGIEFTATPDAIQAKGVFRQLDSKARQYQQHVRLARAYEGLYLRSVAHSDSDTLALHSLRNLPGWPKNLRIEVLDGSLHGRVLDRCGSLDAADCRRLIKIDDHYQYVDVPAQTIVRADFYGAVNGVLSADERAALQFQSLNPANELKLNLRDRALSRAEFGLGLGRMDGGLPFEMQGLRGGGFPTTLQAAALTHETLRLQVRDLYPDFGNAQADEWLQHAGESVQSQLDGLKQQFEQLSTDLTGWIDQSLQDLDDMDLDFLAPGDEDAAGMNHTEIAEHNVALLQYTMEYERETRMELADELISIWQKCPPQANRLYSGETLTGYKLDLDFEDFHRLPVMNVRFNEVIELSMRGFHLIERESLNGFLESFPNLRVLSLEKVDLRLADAAGEMKGVLPPAIPRMSHLTTLNLKATFMQFRENSAAQLCDLINLQSLDLSENPLGVPPMLLGMNELRQVNLRNTGISRCPIGIRDEPYLTSLDLSDNQITRVPPAVLSQAVARDRVRLWGNPLTDEDTLRRLVNHRQRTGINLWLSTPGADYGNPVAWLQEGDEALRQARRTIWQQLAVKPSGGRFLRVIDGLSLTADFQVDYMALQARVWRLLSEAQASDELWGWLNRFVEGTAIDAENPLGIFTAMEDRSRLYRDWVTMGRPFPVITEQA